MRGKLNGSPNAHRAMPEYPSKSQMVQYIGLDFRRASILIAGVMAKLKLLVLMARRSGKSVARVRITASACRT
jgi:hypothetical protein